MKRVIYRTLGCKLNQVETDQVMSELAHRRIGIPVDGEDQPDLIVINTCAVTEKAAAKSRQMVSKMAGLHPDTEIVVMGCSAAMDPVQFDRIESVAKVIGTAERFETEWWSDLAEEAGQYEHHSDDEFDIKPVVTQQNRSRPRLKIQDGCEQNCSYCIIPSLRGHQRSVPLDNLLDSTRQLIDDGAAEIVLTGVRIGSWGDDLAGNMTFINMLEYLLAVPDVPRIRLGSVEPWELTAELIELVNGNPKICSHLHIPLQHTHPWILQRMGRPELDGTVPLIKGACASNRDISIGIDLIAGFPGESEEHFSHLLDTISELPISYIHPFRFSTRPGTPACGFEPQVSPTVAKRRVQELISISTQKRNNYINSQIGKQFIAIPDRGDGEWIKAVTDNYIQLSVPTQGLNPGLPLLVTLMTDSERGHIGLPV